MPNYDYQCTQCAHRFEVFQSMSDPKLDACPKCGGPVERLIGPGAGMIFKGSGFYTTDYRSDAYKSAQKSESKPGKDGSAAAGSGAKDGAAGETKKPAADPKPSSPSKASE